MKKLLKTPALLFALMLIVSSCGNETKSDAERFCEIMSNIKAINSKKTTSRDIENLDKWDIEVLNLQKKYKNNEEFVKHYDACMKEK